MDEQNNGYTSVEQREERKRALLKLKSEILGLTKQMNVDNLNADSMIDPVDSNNSQSQSVGNTKGTSLVKATAVGRKMSDKDYGYVSAIMLGFISFITEIIFLGIAILLFQ